MDRGTRPTRRHAALNQRVRVHFNLHNHLWSVTVIEGLHKGYVVDQAQHVALLDCEFRVSEVMRQRIVRQHVREVHAWVYGTRVAFDPPPASAVAFSYNPYRLPHFTRRDTNVPVFFAPIVWFTGRAALFGDGDTVSSATSPMMTVAADAEARLTI